MISGNVKSGLLLKYTERFIIIYFFQRSTIRILENFEKGIVFADCSQNGDQDDFPESIKSQAGDFEREMFDLDFQSLPGLGVRM